MIITRLLPHQKRLLRDCEGKLPRVALFAPLGCGKSLVALALAEKLSAREGHHDIVITCDKQNALRTWPTEIAKHTDWACYIYTADGVTQPDPLPAWEKHVAHIVGHDLLKHRVQSGRAALEFGRPEIFKLWIADESADYKNPRTWRVHDARKFLGCVPNRIIISGMPVSERIEDIFGQMLCLDDGAALGRNITAFRQRFMLPHPLGYGWVPKVDAVENIAALISPYVVTCSPHDVKLPAKKYNVVHVTMTETQRALYQALDKDFRCYLDNGEKIELNSAIERFTKLHELTGGVLYHDSGPTYIVDSGKLLALHDLLRRTKARKTVVWVRYTAEAELLRRFLWSDWLNVYTFNSTTQDWAKEEFENFRHCKKKCVLVMSLGYAKGLNEMVGCSNVVFYSLPFSYLTYAQAEARTCRIGSKGETTYTILVAEDTVDERIWSMLQLKQDFVQSIQNFREI